MTAQKCAWSPNRDREDVRMKRDRLCLSLEAGERLQFAR
jgi:hypothetical protein